MKRRMGPRWIVFAIAAFVMNFPVLSTFITAFKGPKEVSRNPSLWIEAPTLENFATVLTISDRLNVFQFLTIRRYLGMVFLSLVGLLLVLALWP